MANYLINYLKISRPTVKKRTKFVIFGLERANLATLKAVCVGSLNAHEVRSVHTGYCYNFWPALMHVSMSSWAHKECTKKRPLYEIQLYTVHAHVVAPACRQIFGIGTLCSAFPFLGPSKVQKLAANVGIIFNF